MMEKNPQKWKHVFLLLAAPGYLLMMKWMKRAHQIWSKMKSFLTETCKAILRDSSPKQHVLVQFHRGLVFYRCLLMANSLPNCFDPNKNSAKSLSLIFNLLFGYFGCFESLSQAQKARTELPQEDQPVDSARSLGSNYYLFELHPAQIHQHKNHTTVANMLHWKRNKSPDTAPFIPLICQIDSPSFVIRFICIKHSIFLSRFFDSSINMLSSLSTGVRRWRPPRQETEELLGGSRFTRADKTCTLHFEVWKHMKKSDWWSLIYRFYP